MTDFWDADGDFDHEAEPPHQEPEPGAEVRLVVDQQHPDRRRLRWMFPISVTTANWRGQHGPT